LNITLEALAVSRYFAHSACLYPGFEVLKIHGSTKVGAQFIWL
jgi:hypothetical protein